MSDENKNVWNAIETLEQLNKDDMFISITGCAEDGWEVKLSYTTYSGATLIDALRKSIYGETGETI